MRHNNVNEAKIYHRQKNLFIIVQDIQSLTDYYTKIKLFVTNTILLQIYHHVDVKLLRNGMVGPKLEALAISHGLE